MTLAATCVTPEIGPQAGVEAQKETTYVNPNCAHRGSRGVETRQRHWLITCMKRSGLSGRHSGMGIDRERVIDGIGEVRLDVRKYCTVHTSLALFLVLTLATPTICPPSPQIGNSTSVGSSHGLRDLLALLARFVHVRHGRRRPSRLRRLVASMLRDGLKKVQINNHLQLPARPGARPAGHSKKGNLNRYIDASAPASWTRGRGGY